MEPPATNLAPSTLLVVDDNETVLELLDLLLSYHGSTVVRARSGSECLAVVNRQPVDLVILDVMMPGLDGIEVSAELKRSQPSLPIVLLTAKDDMATRAAAMSLGVSEFVVKPINKQDFLTRIYTHISARRWETKAEKTAADLRRLGENENVKDNG